MKYKLLPDEILSFEENYKKEIIQYKENLEQDLDIFTEEIIIENSGWIKDRRIEYLKNQLIEIQKEIDWWEMIAKMYPGWFGEIIIEANVLPEKKKQRRIGDEIYAYEKPQEINYDKEITDNDIEKAKSVDWGSIVSKSKSSSRGRKLTKCLWHNDHNPSLVLYPDNGGYCFVCNKYIDTIDYIMKSYNLNFIEAVRFLSRY